MKYKLICSYSHKSVGLLPLSLVIKVINIIIKENILGDIVLIGKMLI